MEQAIERPGVEGGANDKISPSNPDRLGAARLGLDVAEARISSEERGGIMSAYKKRTKRTYMLLASINYGYGFADLSIPF